MGCCRIRRRWVSCVLFLCTRARCGNDLRLRDAGRTHDAWSFRTTAQRRPAVFAGIGAVLDRTIRPTARSTPGIAAVTAPRELRLASFVSPNDVHIQIFTGGIAWRTASSGESSGRGR